MTIPPIGDPVAPTDPTSLRARVQSLIEAATSNVAEQVVQHFVKQETDRRAALLIDGLKRLGEAEKAHDGVKADHRIFGEDGSILQFGFSADQKGKKDKAKKKVDRLTEALSKAIGTGDFKALEEALKQND